MKNTATTPETLLNKLYALQGLESAAPDKKIDYLQGLLDVQIGIRFFSIGEDTTVDSAAEQAAILKALEREYIETKAPQLLQPA